MVEHAKAADRTYEAAAAPVAAAAAGVAAARAARDAAKATLDAAVAAFAEASLAAYQASNSNSGCAGAFEAAAAAAAAAATAAKAFDAATLDAKVAEWRQRVDVDWKDCFERVCINAWKAADAAKEELQRMVIEKMQLDNENRYGFVVWYYPKSSLFTRN